MIQCLQGFRQELESLEEYVKGPEILLGDDSLEIGEDG